MAGLDLGIRTGLSIGAAFIIGTIEILGVLTDELHLNGAFWNVVANFNINTAGFAIVALFIAVWVGALAYWRFLSEMDVLYRKR